MDCNINYYAKKIEFDPKDLKTIKILEDNCNYRRFLYNKCVEIVKSLQENHPNKYIGDVRRNDLHRYLVDVYESNYLDYEDLRPEWMNDYDYYFRGISAIVADNISTTINTIVNYRSRNKKSDIHYISYNPNNMMFEIENKLNRKHGLIDGKFYSGNRLVLDVSNPYHIGVKINKDMGCLWINIKESFKDILMDPLFDFNEIRFINFRKHNDKWFITLKCRYSNILISKLKRCKLAGIDLGETNPVVLYNGKKILSIPRHLQYPKDRIAKVDKHIQNCKRVMNRKYNPDMDRFHQSKNYYKVLKKFHKYHERKNNIIKDWHFKLAHWIVTHYKNIVVDDFRDHIIRINSNYPTRLRKNCNRSMYDKSMYNFNQRLIHMSRKYGTNYFRVLKTGFETTNTCSKCGNVNKEKLILDKRIFKCECCGYTCDRDINASINCYTLYKNKHFRDTFLELL